MDEQQMIQVLAEALKMKVASEQNQEISDEDAQNYITQLLGSAETDPESQQQLQDLMDYAKQLGQQIARHGAKLRYTRSLLNTCPSGYEMAYFKAGGRMCKKCMKKAEQGGSVPREQHKRMNAVEEFKCGRKMAKHQKGGKTDDKKSESITMPPYNGPAGLAWAADHGMTTGSKKAKPARKQPELKYDKQDHDRLIQKFRKGTLTPDESKRLGKYNEMTASD